MNKSTLRIGIILFGLTTGVIHLYLNILLGRFDPMFTLNGLGYLTLLGALFLPIGFLTGRNQLIHYVFIGYTLVTIVAWIIMGEKDITTTQGLIGYTDKAIEVLLVAALFAHKKDSVS